MPEIKSMEDLKKAIADLEQQREREGKELKAQAHRTFESLKPIKLMESAVHSAVTSPNIQQDLAVGAVSLAAGYAAKRLVAGKPKGAVGSILGMATELGVANVIARHPRMLKVGFKLVKALLGARKRGKTS